MLMKIVANIIGILSIPVYWYVLAVLFSGLFLAIARLEEFFGVGLWVLSPMGWFFVLPVSVTLSIWFGHLTTRFLLRRSSPTANALDETKADADARS
jgi:hypothetical protein